MPPTPFMTEPRPHAASPGVPHPALAVRRVHRSLTAGPERRLLESIARRLPPWVSSDGLTALGLAAQVGSGIAYAMAGRSRYALPAASLLIVLNWLGDSLDGTVARVRGRQRPRYGFYVDHVVDLLGATAMLSGMALSGLVHPPVALAMLIAFLLLAGESYLASSALGRFEMSHGPFGPTEIRLLLIAANLRLMRGPRVALFGHRWLLLDLGGAIAAAGMTALLLWTAARHTRQLAREEPLPADSAGPPADGPA